ncbi:MAG: DUF5678 domain-containing protein [Clostridia bacterium]|nr:DUF5678 domain-containing protein [Clostridia bacterium]
MNHDLEKSFEFFLDNLESLKKQYLNKFVVIVDCKVTAAYEDYEKALKTTLKTYKLGTFLIQKVDNRPSSFTLYLNKFSVVV